MSQKLIYIRQREEKQLKFYATMKRSIILWAVLFFAAYGLNAQNGMTDEERKFAVKYLNDTQNEMLKILKGLSEAQLNFKPNAESWSVSECLKHITISEQNIWAGFIEAGLAKEADPSKRSEVQFSDEQVMGFLESREQKVKTFAPFEPQNKPETTATVLKEFKKLRSEHIKWVKKTEYDLRNRYGTTPFGTVDLYQAILFMSAHTRRHTDQMKEVMADAGFPK